MDTPARSKVLNMLGHNGEFGCHICEVKLEKTKNCLRYKITKKNSKNAVMKAFSPTQRKRTKKKLQEQKKQKDIL